MPFLLPNQQRQSTEGKPSRKLVAALLKVAGVTAGLAKVMAAYCLVYDSRHLQADYQEPGSAPEPYAR